MPISSENRKKYPKALNLVRDRSRRTEFKMAGNLMPISETDIVNHISIEDEIIAQDELSRFFDELKTLDRDQRDVILMNKLQGFSHRHIANTTGLSISSVEKHAMGAFKKLTKPQ